MPKAYRCNKFNEKGVVCNETNENNFSEGRYNTCKKCRLRIMTEYNKSRRGKKEEESVSKNDLNNHIVFLIEDTISRFPLINNKLTISESIERVEKDISEESSTLNDKIDMIKNKNIDLENEVKQLKFKISLFDTLFERIEILNEKNRSLHIKFSDLENENIILKSMISKFKDYLVSGIVDSNQNNCLKK